LVVSSTCGDPIIMIITEQLNPAEYPNPDRDYHPASGSYVAAITDNDNTSGITSTTTARSDQGASQRSNEGRTPVRLNVYDMVSMQGLNQYSSPLGFGVFHSGVEIYGSEYAYGGHNFSHTGVFEIAPRDVEVLGEDSFKYRETLLIGHTDFDADDVKQIVDSLGEKFRGDKYHLLHQNCNHFTDALTKVLCGQGIPSWVNRLAYVSSCMPFLERWLSKYMPLAPCDELAYQNEPREDNEITPSSPRSQTARNIAYFWRNARAANDGQGSSGNR
ncbi:Deubiquitinase DESI2, partial [Fragariocoptes setiger]